MIAAPPSPTSLAPAATKATALVAVLLAGANFGLFYAWVSTTMWGLDEASAKTAVEAMQAMNASVRNGVFAAVFFTAAPLLLLSAALLWRAGATRAAVMMLSAGLVMALGNNVMTFSVLVPRNEAFGLLAPATEAEAQAAWAAYSPAWQVWNTARTAFCGLSFALALLGLTLT